MLKNTSCKSRIFRKIMDFRGVAGYTIQACFVLILSLQQVACTGGQTHSQVPNAPVQNTQNSLFASRESPESEPAFLKNVCDLTSEYDKSVVVKMSLNAFLQGLALMRQDYDFMWKDAVLDYGDYIELQPYYTTAEVVAFADEYNTIDNLWAYVEGFTYENDTNTELYNLEQVLNGRGNCVTVSMMMGYWLNRHAYENGYNVDSVFDGISSGNKIGAQFVKSHDHVYLQVIIDTDIGITTYNLNPAAGKEEFYDLFMKLKAMEVN